MQQADNFFSHQRWLINGKAAIDRSNRIKGAMNHVLTGNVRAAIK